MATTAGNALLEAALVYAALGWQVFPCQTPTPKGCSCRRDCGRIGKHPRTQHGLKDATTDELTIRRWWNMWPEANIGITTGAVSGLVVLDVDSYKGGDVTLQDLERTYQPLPETVLSLTGGGGVQHFFTHPGEQVKNGVEELGAGLDIRGDGGYVIAPPSLHESGRQYVWEVVHEPPDMPLAPMPAWLLALCRDARRRDAPQAGEPIPSGQRNKTLFKLGCSFRARGCTEAVILAALREMNQTQCQPPLDDDEVETIAASCAAYEAGSIPRSDAHQARNGQTPHPAQADTQAPSTPTQEAGSERPLPYSDYTNALAFVRDHGHNLRYCYPWKSWLVWTGTHWERDTSGEVMRMAKQTVKRLARQIEHLDETPAKALMAHIKASLSTAKLKALVENAQSEEGIPVQPDDVDQDIWALNCANGTLDLRTGALRPHRHADLITRCLALAYDPQATCPTWDAFLWRAMGGSQGKDTPDMSVAQLEQRQVADTRARGLVAYLQRSAGYTLTGSTREQCLFLCHGPTKTGKSTYLATLRSLLGTYGTQTDINTFVHKDRPEVRNDLADLAGARYVYAVESHKEMRLAEGLVKQMTGGVEGMKARFLFENLFEFKPQFKAYIGTNHLPRIKDGDDAIWERIRRIPFTVQIPKEERDKNLDTKLLDELPGILAWAVQGCLDWQRLNDLQEPQAVLDANQEYRVKMDTIAPFLEECCLTGDPEIVKVKASLLAAAYQAWCRRTSEPPETNNTFIANLEDKGYHRRHGHANQYYWHGLGLIPTEDERYA